MSPEFINREKLKFIISSFRRIIWKTVEAPSIIKLHLQMVLALTFLAFLVLLCFQTSPQLKFSLLFEVCDSFKHGPATLMVGRGLPAPSPCRTPSRKAQLPDQPTCTLGVTRIRRPQGSPEMEHQARAHLTVDKE